MHESETSKSLDPDQKTVIYAPGTQVRITGQIPRRLDTYTSVVTGTVIRQERQKSGSWFARNQDDKVWLDRLVVRKPDGEISILNLDEYTRVEILHGPAPASGESPLIEPAQDMTANIT